MKTKRRDTLWKGILQDYFRYFLYFFFDDANELFDMEKPFEFLNREMAQMSANDITRHSTYVDMLAKVYRRDIDDYMLFHVEVQDKRQPSFPERMFDYFIRLIDKYKKRVGSYAIFTSADETYIPCSYEYDFFGTQIKFNFNSFNIATQKDAIIKQPKNPFAFILLTVLLSHQKGRISENDLLKQKIKLVEKLFNEDWPDNQKIKLLSFIRGYIYFEEEEFNHRFEEKVDLLVKIKTKNMGVTERLIEYYQEQGIYKLVKRLVRKKMEPSFILELTHNITGFDIHDIMVVRRRYDRQSLWKKRNNREKSRP